MNNEKNMTIEVNNEGFMDVSDGGSAQVGFHRGADKFLVMTSERPSQRISVTLTRSNIPVEPLASVSTSLFADGMESNSSILDKPANALVFSFESVITDPTKITHWQIHDVLTADGGRTAVISEFETVISANSGYALIGNYRLKMPAFDLFSMDFAVDINDTHALTCAGLSLHVVSSILVLDITGSEGVTIATLDSQKFYKLELSSSKVVLEGDPDSKFSHGIPDQTRTITSIGSPDCKTRNLIVLLEGEPTLVFSQRWSCAEVGRAPKAIRIQV